jgi:thiamine pyrophosphate-dependent acetolactate synthase large subunit-like protein
LAAPNTGQEEVHEQDPQSLARECIIYTATVSAPSTLLKLVGTLFEIFDSQRWMALRFITDMLEDIATSSEKVYKYERI